MGNVGGLCPECSAKRKEIYREHFKRDVYEVGFYVVVPFKSERTFKDDEGKDRHHIENMWVAITKRNGDAYKGTLENHPFNSEYYDIKCKDIVEFNKEDIIDDQDANVIQMFVQAGGHIHN